MIKSKPGRGLPSVAVDLYRSEELLIRNRTWDARRATVGPHLAAISGQRRSLRVSPTGVCSKCTRGVECFQAGHASSILVTRPAVKALVKGFFCVAAMLLRGGPPGLGNYAGHRVWLHQFATWSLLVGLRRCAW